MEDAVKGAIEAQLEDNGELSSWEIVEAGKPAVVVLD